jgi:hypothetical protein
VVHGRCRLRHHDFHRPRARRADPREHGRRPRAASGSAGGHARQTAESTTSAPPQAACLKKPIYRAYSAAQRPGRAIRSIPPLAFAPPQMTPPEQDTVAV